MAAETFEIVVKGRLSSTLVAALDGMEVSHSDHGMTHLVGYVPDQSRLHSLLERLRDLNIQLVSVNPVSVLAPTRAPPGGPSIPLTEGSPHD